MAIEVNESDFQERVIDRSRELPVVVDFWAEWCGPCRTLAPALEQAVRERDGEVELAKVDVDRNQMLASAFGIRGIPAVKAFRDGRVADEFTGAIPPADIARFLDRLVPSPADKLVAEGDEDSLRRALEIEPRHGSATRELGRLLVRRGELEEAGRLLAGVSGDFVADGLAARLELGADPELESSFAAWDDGDLKYALELLQGRIAAADPGRRDLLRRVMVAILTELGTDHPIAREHRRRLAAALS